MPAAIEQKRGQRGDARSAGGPERATAAAPVDGARKFGYRARKGADVVRGVVEAASHAAAVRELRRQGLVVLAVELTNADAPVGVALAGSVNRLSAGFSKDDVVSLCQQLAVMLKTGVPLAEALKTFADQSRKREVREIVQRIHDEVCEGEDFSHSLSKWPRVFPPILVSLMQAAEASGMLDEMLSRVAKDLARERKTVKQVKGAMTYPVIMFLVAVSAVLVIMLFVLPKFMPIFKAQGDRLPVPTKVLLGISNFLQFQWKLYVPGLLVSMGTLFALSQTPRGRRVVDYIKLRAPVVGPMFRQMYLARMASTMATLLAAGVSLLEVVGICRAVTNNHYYGLMWDELRERIERGQDMATAFRNAWFIPPNVSAMFNAGERSGRLPEVLGNIAIYAEEDLEIAIKATTSMIEPIMIVGMGLLVGGIASAMLLPIFQMSKMSG
ncbi:MAG: type II secretion system F family protein [Phycisphaeraceae bacterium]|nr:type II secretion system F family protein [Phycisphaeraceae bacterium]